MFEKAIALDPQYAEAYAWLGWTYWHGVGLVDGVRTPRPWSGRLRWRKRPLPWMTPCLVAHSVLSVVYAQKQQYDQAIAEGRAGHRPRSQQCRQLCNQAEVLNFAGRPEEALRMVEQAMRLNPRYPPVYLFELGWAYRLTGRYAEAVATLKEALSRNPNFLRCPLAPGCQLRAAVGLSTECGCPDAGAGVGGGATGHRPQ